MNAVGISISPAGPGCKRPRCGCGKLELPDVRESREVRCQSDAGDGPAVFVVFPVGAAGLAPGFETAFAPPVRAPVPGALSIALLRPFKGVPAAPHCRNVEE